MSCADVPTVGDIDQSVRDAEDVIIVVKAVFCAELANVSVLHRDALAAVVRLGRDRVARDRDKLEEMGKAAT